MRTEASMLSRIGIAIAMVGALLTTSCQRVEPIEYVDAAMAIHDPELTITEEYRRKYGIPSDAADKSAIKLLLLHKARESRDLEAQSIANILLAWEFLTEDCERGMEYLNEHLRLSPGSWAAPLAGPTTPEACERASQGIRVFIMGENPETIHPTTSE